jgi:hypothetical protein
VEVAKEILDSIMSGHVEGEQTDDMDYTDNDDDIPNRGRCRPRRTAL